MSKAFTRESDDSPDSDAPLRQFPTVPAGAKNYVTERGAKLLRARLERLLNVERTNALGSPDPAIRAGRLAQIDHEIRHIRESLSTAVVVPTPPQPWEVVRFGATVSTRDSKGIENRFQIVGVDESDADLGLISWCSPIARSLTGARKGERVQFQSPQGEQDLEIVEIGYRTGQ